MIIVRIKFCTYNIKIVAKLGLNKNGFRSIEP